MLRESSQEEIDARRAKVREYRLFSRDPRKRLIGILMDTSVGDLGLWEATAEKKADEILKEFTCFTI